MNLKRQLRGSETGADVRMLQRALNKAPSRTVIAVTGRYDETTKRRVRAFRVANSLSPGDGVDQALLEALWPYFDLYGKWRYRLYRPPRPKPEVPDLGPVYPGGASILFHSLTHETDGFPNEHYPESCLPAFDDGWRAGRAVIAPEDLKVFNQSSSAGGDAFFARGKSKLEYWFGHLSGAPPTGSEFKKGQTMGVIANIPQSQGGPHVHTGINAVPLIGHELEHKKNYQTGAPSVGEQLTRALT